MPPRYRADDGDDSNVGQAFQPDVSLERLTYSRFATA